VTLTLAGADGAALDAGVEIKLDAHSITEKTNVLVRIMAQC
jgi:hypothetical protein